jgi:hypothetical protein
MTRSTYRVVSKTSDVDESLFGHTKNKAKLRATSSQGFDVIETKAKTLSGVSRASSGLHGSRFSGSAGTSSSGAGSSPKSASALRGASDHAAKTLSASEISRMKQPASALTHDEITRIRAERRDARDAERARGRARRERMEAIELNRANAKEVGETEALRRAEALGTRNRAEVLMDEAMDEVKNMNQMMLYSKCVTIRDAQLEEKKHIKAEAQEEERRMDLAMEIERIKALDEYEAREAARREERLAGAAVLMKQIEDRARERTRQEELLDMDRRQMLSEIQRMKDEEAEEARRRREAGAALLSDVAEANAAQLDRKREAREFEREEEARIAAYLAERDRREIEAELEKARVAREKELETARMRAQQEKQADTAAELDELRAARVYEERERAFRAKERAAAERAAAINADLAQAREHQKMLKLKALGDQAREERAEFHRVIDAQMRKEREDAEAAAFAATARRDHREELQSQIAFNAERRARERREYEEEGDRLRAALAQERAKLEAIKQRKLDELEDGGIPAKYRAELAKKKIGA